MGRTINEKNHQCRLKQSGSANHRGSRPAGHGPAGVVHADHAGAVNKQAIEETAKKSNYSPYAGRSYPTTVLWGDTHVHTSLSLDARALGPIPGPDDAYRFARGEEVTSGTGLKVKLSRPLDWLVISDHSDAMGAMNEIVAGNPTLLRDPIIKKWHAQITKGGDSAYKAAMDIIATFSQGKTPEVLKKKKFADTVWDRYLETAEKYNDPGVFSAIIGYEWTSTENGNNLHRNVLYRDNSDLAKQMLPTLPQRVSTPRTSGSGWKPMNPRRAGMFWPWPITATSATG